MNPNPSWRHKVKPSKRRSAKDIAEDAGAVLSGPYYQFGTPYGYATLHRDVWWLSRNLAPADCRTEIERIFKGRTLGSVIRFRDKPRRYVIDDQRWPSRTFGTLADAVTHLLAEEKNDTETTTD